MVVRRLGSYPRLQPASRAADRGSAATFGRARRPVPTVSAHGNARSPVRPAPRGLRGRRRLPALARQDDHRVRRPPVLHDHDEPPPAAHQRVVRRERDRAEAERGRGQPRLLAGAGHERARRERGGGRQPRDRDPQARQADVPRRHHLRRHQGAGQEGDVRRQAGHRHRRDQGHQPARGRGLLLQAQPDGVEVRVRPAPRFPLRRRRVPGERGVRRAEPQVRAAALGFDSNAGAYDRARPSYPAEVVAHSSATAASGPGAGARPGRRHRQADPPAGAHRRRGGGGRAGRRHARPRCWRSPARSTCATARPSPSPSRTPRSTP